MKADSNGAIQTYLVLSACLLLALFSGCAEVAVPPGGPEDKQGPFLLGSIPADGAVSVARGNSITLYFSEPILPPRTGKAIFVSPRPETEPDIKWKSDHVIIALADSFETDRTYMISAGSQIVDLRGNRVDSGLTIAFSCGASIDSGTVAGHIYDLQGKPARGLTVGLYEDGPTDGYDSLYPAYVTETADDGYFRLDHLPALEYRLIAFRDGDRDERFATLTEAYAVPDRPLNVAGKVPLDDLRCTLVEQDTTTPGIISARQTDDGLIQIRFSRSVDLLGLTQDPARCWLTDSGLTEVAAKAATFLKIGDSVASSITVYFQELPPGLYDVHVTYVADRPPLVFSAMKFRDKDDQTPPTVIAFEPDDGNLMPADKTLLTWTFSEPVNINQEYVTQVLSQDSDEVAATTSWRSDALHLEVVPQELLPGQAYRVEMAEFEVSDLAGNLLGDTLRSYSFATADPDKLGWVMGTVEVALPERRADPVQLTLRSPDGKVSYGAVAVDGSFSAELPAGDYLLSGYIDSNNNGLRDYGQVWRYRYAETYATYADTIKVRARFETTGIQFLID
ncbi:MAG: Ig-like domain-containing protein [bacterium]